MKTRKVKKINELLLFQIMFSTQCDWKLLNMFAVHETIVVDDTKSSYMSPLVLN